MDVKTLKKIRSFTIKEYAKSQDRQHNFAHAERVAKNALWITDVLKIKEGVDKNLLQAACYLHDIVLVRRNNGNYFSWLYNHIFEKHLNKRYLKEILECFGLPQEENKILTAAIVNHSYSIPYRLLNKQGDLYSKILQDADSLDYVSVKRADIFIKKKGKILTHLINLYLSWIKNDLGRYLNFPQLTNE